MYLVQILLPLRDNEGKAIAAAKFRRLATELAAQFGGLTAYTHAPAEGLWKRRRDARPERDHIVVYEVMSETLQRKWWARKRSQLQKVFRQQEILIRGHRVTAL